MNLNTSFTGDDNLYVRLRTGNGKGPADLSTKRLLSIIQIPIQVNMTILKLIKSGIQFPIGRVKNGQQQLVQRLKTTICMQHTVQFIDQDFKTFTLGGNGGALVQVQLLVLV